MYVLFVCCVEISCVGLKLLTLFFSWKRNERKQGGKEGDCSPSVNSDLFSFSLMELKDSHLNCWLFQVEIS